ncbi:hypothetical protein [Pseudoroseicyclus sp. CXY001]|uniref:hypothetical protein n=1 Tax=Pseudoroseicyclus sp. CXY001 TaxID=3242492 RepID=UPI0035715B07
MFFRPRRAAPRPRTDPPGPLDHPAIAAMSQRDLADLPLPRPDDAAPPLPCAAERG